MPLILAIEPDKKQASQLTALVRGRLHAELILGDTAERALAALGQRVPDLILTSALLSPKDETALGERLRALDATAAAHVQTLTTPVLASPGGLTGGRASGMLSALRREKAAPATQAGCDPAVFAEQCREYLERAATERAAMAERTADAAERMEARSIVSTPSVQAEPSEAVDTYTEPLYTSTYAEPAYTESQTEPLYSYAATTEPIEQPFIVDDAPSVVHDVPFVEPVVEPAFEPAVASVVAAPPPDAQPEPRSIFGLRGYDADGPASLLAAVAALAAEEEVVAVEVERANAMPIVEHAPVVEQMLDEAILDEAAIDEPIAAHASAPYQFVDLDLSDLLDDPALAESGRRSRRDEERVEEDEDSVSIYELDASTLADFEAAVPRLATPEETEPEATWSETELYMPLPRATMLRWPMLAIASDTPRPVVVVPVAAQEPDEMKEWLDIIEALRRDAAMEPRPLNATATAEPPALEDPFEDASGRKRRKRQLDAPAQDEWGFFDPEQCGFQALLAKLEEITEDDRRTPRP